MSTYVLTEQQLRNSTPDRLVEYCLGLQHTANTLINRLEQVTGLIDQAYRELGTVPSGQK